MVLTNPWTGEESPGLIDWASMPTYNTIMSLAAGAGLLGLLMLYRELRSASGARRLDDEGDVPGIAAEGWALTFGVLGVILTTTGLHMSLTWPLAAGGFAFDNVIFGEPSLAFGVLLLGAAIFFWKRANELRASVHPLRVVARHAAPASIFVVGLGLACFAIAVAGVVYQLFAAPPQEPISGAFAEWPILEAIFISGLYALVGLGAVLFPAAVTEARTGALGVASKVAGVAWGLAGLAFLLFGAMNYYTHIGLIVNTM